MICVSCHAQIDPGDVFCRNCGKRQVAPAATTREGERRQLTAMFYDLVGSTDMSTRTDPEDLQIVLMRYQDMCAGVVANFGGHPASTMGDGGLVYFGFPIAHEDDPLRAVMAGRALLSELAELNAIVRSEVSGFTDELMMRVGIHTGTVVVGDVGPDLGIGRLAVGQTINQASRIESLAPVNAIAISDVTAHRIRGVVDLTSLGQHEVKGIAEPIEIFGVNDVRHGQSRFLPAQLSPLIGRDDDLERLKQAWLDASAGQPTTVVLRGEAGIGKSRLHHALRQQLSDTLHTWVEIQTSAVLGRSAFQPIIQMLPTLMGGETGTTSERLASALEGIGITDEERLELLSVLLSLQEPDSTKMAVEQRHSKTIDAVCDWLLATAGENPTVLVVEDLHWIDPSTFEVLNRIIDRASDDRLLLVVTTRPEFEITWDSQVQVIDLEPLKPVDAVRLIDELAESAGLTKAQRLQLAERSDGVPLFAEELIHAATDGSSRNVDGIIPATLSDLLNARLDRLGPAREVVQLASLLGREFSFKLLSAVADPKVDLEATLSQLVDQRFLTRQGFGSRAGYLFRHALLLDAAQDSMLRRTQQAEHRRIARVLSDSFAGSPDGRPEIIGHHYEQGEEYPSAIDQFVIAGVDASNRAALREAAGHFSHSLDILNHLPEGNDRDRLEITLQLELGSALARGESFSYEATGAAYLRAETLCRAISSAGELHAVALDGLLQHYISAANFDDALMTGEQLRLHAEASDEQRVALTAHRALCQVHFWPGRFDQVREQTQKALELYDRNAPREERYELGIETGVLALTYGACANWALGMVETSRQMADQAIELASAQNDDYQVAYACSYLAIHSIMLNDPKRCEKLATIANELSVEHGFPPLAGLSFYARGWAHAMQGVPDGLANAKAGVGQLAGLGVGTGAPGCMAVIAELCALEGEVEEGFGFAELGLAMAEQSGQHFYTAELHRSTALLHLQVASAAGDDLAARQKALAEAEFAAKRALEVADSQNAPSLALRAAEPLQRLMEMRGEATAADELRQSIVSRFPKDADIDMKNLA
jgi:predicted ATPase/class 3 adenylate cyclase